MTSSDMEVAHDAPSDSNDSEFPVPDKIHPAHHFWAWLGSLINKYLCCRPDARPLWLSQWWYNLTGRVEAFCSRRASEGIEERSGE